MKQRLFKFAGVLPMVIAIGGLVAGVVIVFATSGNDDKGSSAANNASRTASPGPGESAAPAQVWLGIAGDVAANGKGVAINDVSAGSPADDAGIRSGDVILSIDGTAVNDVQTLASQVTSHTSGDKVTLSLIKNGVANADATPADVEVTLEPRPASPTAVPQPSPASGQPYLGISGGPAADNNGVAIKSVTDGSPAARAGLKAGDLILKADGKTVNDIPSLAGIVTGHEVGDQLTLTVVKDGVAHPNGDATQVTVTLEARPADGSGSPAPAPLPTAWLGIAGETGANGGVDVTDVVAGGPADKAGLKTGDHIFSIDGEDIETFDVLAGIIAVHSPGDDVTFSVIKDGIAHPDNARADVSVTLGERPTSQQSFSGQLPLIPGLDSLLPDLQSLIGGQSRARANAIAEST